MGFEVHTPPIDQFDRIEDMAQHVLSRFPHIFGLVGLSMGGIVAQKIASLKPHAVDRLVLMSTLARPLGNEFQDELRFVRGELDKGKLAELAEWASKGWVPAYRHGEKQLMERIKTMAIQAGAQANLNTMVACATYSDLRPEISKITAKTLILCGKEDTTALVSLHEEIAELIPKSKFIILDDTGHLLPMEQPEKVTELMTKWFD